jgi:hypothetical protein
MSQTLSKKKQERLASLIVQVNLLGHTRNDLDLYRSAQAVILLDNEFGIRLPSLQRAKEILGDLQRKTIERNRNEATQLRG